MGDEAIHTVFLFRDKHFAPAGDTVVSVAPAGLVEAVYGGGGLAGEAGLAAAFGGALLFRDDEIGVAHLGVWGSRNTSRFRSDLRQSGAILEIVEQSPPGKLVWYQTHKTRPKRS